MFDCGIYQLTFPNGKFYIGSSCQIHVRFNVHIKSMNKGRHINDLMQRTFQKYGAPSLKILLICQKEQLKFYEQIVLDGLRPEINLNRFADRPDYNEEIARKLSVAQRGRIMSSEHRARLSAAAKGKKKSEAHCASLSAARKGFRHSEETKLKMSLARQGRKVSEETKYKISKKNSGKKRTLAERARMSAANTAAKTRIRLANGQFAGCIGDSR